MLVRIEAYHDGQRWCARGIGEDILSQGDSFEDLIANVKEAVEPHIEGTVPPPDVLILSEVKLGDGAPATG
jgi:hypothetical protein